MEKKYIRASFTNYITKIISNASANYFKKEQKNKKEIALESVAEESLSAFNKYGEELFFFDIEESITFENMEEVVNHTGLYKAIKGLKTIHKQILYYTVLEQLSAKETAEQLNISIEKVYNVKKYAIQKILKEIDRG